MECFDIEGRILGEHRSTRLLAEADERLARIERLVDEAEAGHRNSLSRSARQRKLVEKGTALLQRRQQVREHADPKDAL